MVNDVFQWDISSGVVAGSVLGGSNLFDTTNSNINGIWSKLNSYSNRLSLKNKLTASALNGNLNIYIDDSVIGWTLGQSFKVAFDTIDVDGNNIKIWTNKSGGWQNIVDIDPSQLITNKPYIELVCIDPQNYVFEVDILR